MSHWSARQALCRGGAHTDAAGICVDLGVSVGMDGSKRWRTGAQAKVDLRSSNAFVQASDDRKDMSLENKAFNKATRVAKPQIKCQKLEQTPVKLHSFLRVLDIENAGTALLFSGSGKMPSWETAWPNTLIWRYAKWHFLWLSLGLRQQCSLI